MTIFKPYPSIVQFRNVVKRVVDQAQFVSLDSESNPVYNKTVIPPILTYKGTVKLHGTNACIHKSKQGEYSFQSRNRLITKESDNCGFVHEMSQKPLDELLREFDGKDVYVYGEWCGTGIQKGVAISQLPKMFVVFEVIVDGVKLVQIENIKLPEHRIFNINQFQTFTLDIDFNNPQKVQNKLIEITTQVESKCPVSSFFGINGIGEGVVWSLAKNCNNFKVGDSELTFKVKGEKHSVTKVKTLASVDVELLNSITDFISNTVTEQRLQQAIYYMQEMQINIDIKNTGDFVRWVYNDILKEESDVIDSSNLDTKTLGFHISKHAKFWFFKYLEQSK